MKIGSTELPDFNIPHASPNEKLIVGVMVSDLLAAGCSLTIYNGGDQPELEAETDAAKIFAALSASDEDEIVAVKDGKRAGWVSLVWGNDCSVISNYTAGFEDLLARANKLAEELDVGQ
jgi:hypothetical protein